MNLFCFYVNRSNYNVFPLWQKEVCLFLWGNVHGACMDLMPCLCNLALPPPTRYATLTAIWINVKWMFYVQCKSCPLFLTPRLRKKPLSLVHRKYPSWSVQPFSRLKKDITESLFMLKYGSSPRWVSCLLVLGPLLSWATSADAYVT